MAKRQRRISGHLINPDLQEVLEQSVCIIMRNGEVYCSRILKINSRSLLVEDMRSLKKEIIIDDIDEIIVDKREE